MLFEDHIDLFADLNISGQVKSIVSGVSPMVVTSRILNINFNADLLDDEEGSYYLDFQNFTGRAAFSQLPQISPGLIGRYSTGTGDMQQITLGSGFSLPGGQLTYTETDPTVPGHVKAITGTQISNWDTAYASSHPALSITGQSYLTLNAATQQITAGAINLNSTHTSGVLPVTKGGTGLSSLGTAGQLLRVNGAGNALEYYSLPSPTIPDLQAVTDQGATTTNNIIVSNSGGGAIQVMNSDDGSYVFNAVSPTISAIAGYHTEHSFGIGSNSSLGAAFLLFNNNTTSDEWILKYSSGLSATLGAGNQLRVQQDPVHANDLARKAYVDSLVAAIPGTVTSVSSGNLTGLFTTLVSNATSTPSISFTLSDQLAYTVFARGSGNGAPSFQALVADHIPDLNASKITTGTLPVTRGGTGAGTLTGILVGNGTSSITAITGSSDQLLRRNTANTGYEFFTHDFISSTLIGANNGIAPLDATGKIPSGYLPVTGMQYKGTWDASTNTPTLSDATGQDGWYYRVTVAGTQNLGSGNITFSVGDDVIHNGVSWERAPSGVAATNLSVGTRTNTTLPITNSNGTGFSIPLATGSLAGIISGDDYTKLQNAITGNQTITISGAVNGSGTTSIVTTFRNSAALSVIGRSANSVGAPSDITAVTDGHVLRRSGTSLGFGLIGDNSISSLSWSKLSSVPTTLSGYGIQTEADSRYVNTTGDTMTGTLNVKSSTSYKLNLINTQDISSAVDLLFRNPTGNEWQIIAANTGNTTFGDVDFWVNSLLINGDPIATEDWVESKGYLTSAPNNYVTTDTNQTGLAGNKSWTGQHKWTLASSVSPSVEANSISFARGGTGIYLTGYDMDAVQAFVLRTGEAGGIQLTLNNGGVSTPNHGNSSQWYQSYQWGNHAGLYVPIGRTVTVGTGLSGGGALSSNISINLDTNLANLNALSTNGFVKKTGASTWTIDTNTYLTSADLSGYLTEANADNRYMSTSNSYGGGSSSYTGIDLDGIVRTSTTYHSSAINHPTGFNYGHVTTFVYGGHRAQLFLASDAADAFYYRQKHHANSTYSSWRQVASRSWTENYVTSILPTVNNGTLTLAVGTGLTGSASFTANQSGNSTFTVGLGTNLSNFNALSSTGFVKKTGANTWTIDTNTYLTANQTITLTGDITGSGTTSIPTTISNNVVTYAKLQQAASPGIIGRSTAGSGNYGHITIGTGLSLSSGVLSATSTGGANLTPGVGLSGDVYNGSTARTWTIDLSYLRQKFVSTNLDGPGNLDTTSTVGANDIEGTSVIHTTATGNRPVASQGIISTFLRNGTTGYQTYFAPVVSGDSYYYRGISAGFSSWYQHASREWVSANYALLSAIPTNYVTTDTNQSSLGGHKAWTGSHRWTLSSNVTPSVAASSIAIGKATSGIYLIAYDNDANQAFAFRTYAASNYQLTLDKGGIETSNHGNSSQWNSAYTWVNTYGSGLQGGPYVPTSRTVSAGNGLTGGGSLATNISLSVNFGTSAGTVAQGNDSRINNGQTAYSWGNHASAGYVPSSRTVGTAGSLTGGGNLGSNRTLQLVNDNGAPGNNKYYGTNNAGVKGFYDLPSTSSFVPTSRTITINGVTQNLSDNRSWTIPTGVTGSGSNGYIARWNSGSGITNSELYQSGSNIGIGTTSPVDKLTINGTLGVIGDAAVRGTALHVHNNLAIGKYDSVPGNRAHGSLLVHSGDTSTYAHVSAALEIRSTTKALLLPRQSTTQWDNIGSKPEGLFSYDTTDKSIRWFTGTETIKLFANSLGFWVFVGGIYRRINFDL